MKKEYYRILVNDSDDFKYEMWRIISEDKEKDTITIKYIDAFDALEDALGYVSFLTEKTEKETNGKHES